MATSQDLIEALKHALKARGLTYEELAPRLNVSLSAVKKIFTASDIEASRLLQILGILDLRLADLDTAAASPAVQALHLLPEQERRILENFKGFAIYWKLKVERASLDSIKKDTGFSDKEIARYLGELKDAGLDPENARQWDFLGDGPLLSELRAVWSKRVVENALKDAGAQHALRALLLSPKSVGELKSALDAVIKEFEARAKSESAGKDLKAVGVVTAVSGGSLVENYRRV